MTKAPAQARIRRIGSVAEPQFADAYAMLFREFGEKGEVETQEILAQRFAWNGAPPADGYALHYELLTVEDPASGQLIAVSDHSVIVRCDPRERELWNEVVVHASHSFVDPAFRGRGLTHELLCQRIETARRCFSTIHGTHGDAPARVAVVGEVEIPTDDPRETGKRAEQIARLKWLGRTGYRRVDPAAIAYAQPDFRTPAEIDATGGARPLPLWLFVRRVDRESETHMPRAHLRHYVASLYHMYGRTFRAQDMAPLWKLVDGLDADAGSGVAGESIRLLPPAQGFETP